MTTFDKTVEPETHENKAVETQPPNLPVVLQPHFKNNAKLWDEAMRFAEMLTYCRPHQSKTERRFIEAYIRPAKIKYDKKGNMYHQIGPAPVVLWSCHVDTVHTKKGMQKIEYWVDAQSGDTLLGVTKDSRSACLGGDDTTGVWLMLEMIKHKVPGLYIFHRGEECGGIGSKWIAENGKIILDGIKFAIAFDRKDTKSIITYQRSTRCCSDEFANSLAEQLGMEHKCDDTGMWTDTAAYVDLIAECTNVSSGYFNAHSKDEYVNVDYLFKLRDALCKIDVSKLVEKRKPGENTYKYQNHQRFYGYNEWGGNSWWSREKKRYERPEGALTGTELREMYGDQKNWIKYFAWNSDCCYWTPIKGTTLPEKLKLAARMKDAGVTKVWSNKNQALPPSDGSGKDLEDIAKLIRFNLYIIADLLESQGYGPKEIKEHIQKCGGYVEDDSFDFWP
jgi:hypothetical protein